MLQHMGGINAGKRLFDCLQNNESARHFCHLISDSDAPQEVAMLLTDKQSIKDKFGITEDALLILLFASPFSINRDLIRSLSSISDDSAKASIALSKVTHF